jgi:hypothetical protein
MQKWHEAQHSKLMKSQNDGLRQKQQATYLRCNNTKQNISRVNAYHTMNEHTYKTMKENIRPNIEPKDNVQYSCDPENRHGVDAMTEEEKWEFIDLMLGDFE